MQKFHKFKRNLTVTLMTGLVCGLSFTLPVKAEVKQGFEHYVTDDIDIPFRSQPGYKYRIVRLIKTGSKVEVLEVNEKKWAKVAYVDRKGKRWEGWMPSIMLQNEPVSRHKVKLQQEKYVELEQRFNEAKLEKETLQARYDEVAKELEVIQKDHFQLDNEYQQLKSVSSNTVNLSSENERLTAEVQNLNAENLIMKEQLNEAEDVVQRQWFLNGAGVLLLGLLIGRFARAPEKRKRWNSL